MSDSDGVFSVFKQEGNRSTPYYCRWSTHEDQLLFDAVQLYGPHKWSLISKHVPGRTPVQCSTRWLGALNPNVHKGRWSSEEDQALTLAVQSYLVDLDEESLPWSRIAQSIPHRTGIQCQARWTEALDPSVRKGRWKKEEDDLLKSGVEQFGCCWIRVAGSIPGRTQRQCRTRWNQIQSKQEKLKLKQMGKLKKKKRTKAEPVMIDNTAIIIPSSPLLQPCSSTSSLSGEDDDSIDLYFEEERRRDYFEQKKQQLQFNTSPNDPHYIHHHDPSLLQSIFIQNLLFKKSCSNTYSSITLSA